MILKIKKTDEVNAVIPKYANLGDAGLDLTITSIEHIDTEHIKYSFGLALEIPKGYVGLIFPRSSCYKQRQLLSNAVGVIDNGYRGEISAVFLGTEYSSRYKIGERCAQLVIMELPNVEVIEVNELSNSERGTGSYGSSGK